MQKNGVEANGVWRSGLKEVVFHAWLWHALESVSRSALSLYFARWEGGEYGSLKNYRSNTITIQSLQIP